MTDWNDKTLLLICLLITLVIVLAFGCCYWYLRWRQVGTCDNLAAQLQTAEVDCSASGKQVILITSCCKYADSVIQDWMMAQGCIVESVTEPPPLGSCDWTYEYVVDDGE